MLLQLPSVSVYHCVQSPQGYYEVTDITESSTGHHEVKVIDDNLKPVKIEIFFENGKGPIPFIEKSLWPGRPKNNHGQIVSTRNGIARFGEACNKIYVWHVWEHELILASDIVKIDPSIFYNITFTKRRE